MFRLPLHKNMLIIILMTLTSCGESNEQAARQLHGFTMGTSYSITLTGDSFIDPEAVTEVLENIENTMSTYRPDSELMILNAAPINTWIPVSSPLYEVLSISQQVSSMTGGAFDITVAPLVNLWGFGPEVRTDGRLPSAAEIAEARSGIGYQHLQVNESNGVFKNQALELDLSAVAKGYAVDKLTALLDALGIDNYLVEIGGELSSKGRNFRGEPWHIAIENPQSVSTSRQSQRIIDIENMSVASSGDYRNYDEVDGRKYSHTIDPRSGNPVSHPLVSVTVLAESTARADALATAFNVMGTEQAMQIANENDIAAYFLEIEEGVLVERFSTAFKHYIGDNP